MYGKKLKPKQPLSLKREPQNSYDENAIEVYWKGVKLGYIPRVDNEIIANLMDQKKEVKASIKNKRLSRNPWERVEIKVELLG